MRIRSEQEQRDRDKSKNRKKKKQSNLEAEIFSIMEKSLKTALDVALDDILKDWIRLPLAAKWNLNY